MSARAAGVAWMGELHERVQEWVRAGQIAQGETTAYVDLIFAFGLARIGAEGESRKLHQIAAASLADTDAAHQFLLAGHSWRVEEARAGRPHAGRLPEPMYQYLAGIGTHLRYVVDRYRKHSRILEPDGGVNPYRHWLSKSSEFERQIAQLQDRSTPEAFRNEADEVLSSPTGSTPEGRSRIGLVILQHYSLARADQVRAAAREVLSREEPDSELGWGEAYSNANAALPATARFGFREELLSLTDRVRHWATRNVEELHGFPPLIRSCIDALDAIDGPHGPDEFLADISRTLMGDASLAEWIARATPADSNRVRILLAVADRWYRFGKDGLANPVIRGSISLLRKLWEQLEAAARVQARLAAEIVGALRSASPPVSAEHIEALLKATPRFLNSPNVESYIDHLKVLESILDGLADPALRSSLVTHATMGEQARKAARDQAQFAREIVESLRSASRPVASAHIANLFEALPLFEDGSPTRSHFHTTALEFAEALCLTAVEVCSHV